MSSLSLLFAAFVLLFICLPLPPRCLPRVCGWIWPCEAASIISGLGPLFWDDRYNPIWNIWDLIPTGAILSMTIRRIGFLEDVESRMKNHNFWRIFHHSFLRRKEPNDNLLCSPLTLAHRGQYRVLYFIFGARLGRQLSYLLRAHMAHIGFSFHTLRCKI